MDLRTYLTGKKIDTDRFKTEDPARFQEFETHFAQMHPDSFTAQKLFLINKLRRSYKLEDKNVQEIQPKPKAARPRVVPKPKKPE